MGLSSRAVYEKCIVYYELMLIIIKLFILPEKWHTRDTPIKILWNLNTDVEEDNTIFVTVHVCVDGEIHIWNYSSGGFIIKDLLGANAITAMDGAPGSGFFTTGTTPSLFVTPAVAGNATLVSLSFVVQNVTSVKVTVETVDGAVIVLETVWTH